MLIKIKSPIILKIFGWENTSSSVTASHRLWIRWLTRGLYKYD